MRRSLRWFSAEFLVVLAGVLAAFAVNAWWEHRQDRAAEQAALRELDNALAADIADLQDDMSEYSKLGHGDSVLIDRFDRGLGYSDSILPAFNALTIFRTHVANSAPFESLKSRGLALISDDSLRLQLIDFYAERTAGVALVNATNTEIVQKLLWPYYLSRVKVPRGKMSVGATIRANYSTLASDSYFRNLLLHQSQSVQQALSSYANALKRAQALRLAVEAHISRV
ncbi:MAG: hypothetical protein M3037_10475 [Gemmatimonadota bacterium]|nr:hypothetical protein [Gemmatimonadota bacterium]